MSHANDDSLQNAEEAAGTFTIFPEFFSYIRDLRVFRRCMETRVDKRWMNDTMNWTEINRRTTADERSYRVEEEETVPQVFLPRY